jgi:hypothetical protein
VPVQCQKSQIDLVNLQTEETERIFGLDPMLPGDAKGNFGVPPSGPASGFGVSGFSRIKN